jgi:hypothetical protein
MKDEKVNPEKEKTSKSEVKRGGSKELQLLTSVENAVKKETEFYGSPTSEIDEIEVLTNVDSAVYKEYVEQFVLNLLSAQEIEGNKATFTVEDMDRYLKTLVQVRIKMVSRAKVEFTWKDTIAIPAFFALLLSKIGKSTDYTLGVTIVPKFDETDFKAMEFKEVRNFSNKLFSAARRFRFELATQLPRDLNGDWEFMSMQLVEGQIRHHSGDPAPYKAVLASVFAWNGLNALLLPRVIYGYTNTWIPLIRRFAHVES